MNYTVKQLATLAGVSIRTLHYYDEIGLLAPSVVGANGYRYYDQHSLLRLQAILFYRELDFPREAIKALLDQPEFDAIRTLQQQRAALVDRVGRLHRMIATLDQTLHHLKGNTPMPDHELFQGLTPAQEEAHADEAARRWDPATVRASQRRWRSYSAERRKQILDEGNAGIRALVAAMPLGAASAPVQAGIARWREHINLFWTPDDEQCVGLARLYRDDPAFRQNFDRIHPDLAAFMVEAVELHVARRSTGG